MNSVTDAHTLLHRYTLTGSNTSECLANGMWSSPAPICSGTWRGVLSPPSGLTCFCIALQLFLWLRTAVQCGLAPIPLHGMIVYDKSVRGNKTHYGTEGTYTCLPPYVLMGGARAACTASGTWTETPECKCTKGREKQKRLSMLLLLVWS